MLARPSVLLIDDDPDVRLMIRLNLGFEGFDVEEGIDGFDGLAHARAHRPDAVVLDMMMPGRDGLDVLRQLRADPTMDELPVIVLTARADGQAETEAWAAGATGFIAKPFTVSVLADRLRELIDASGEPPLRDRESAATG